MTDVFADCADALSREDKAANTIEGYLGDLRHFAHWFYQTNGQDFSPALLTPMDIKNYRRYMKVDHAFRPTPGAWSTPSLSCTAVFPACALTGIKPSASL